MHIYIYTYDQPNPACKGIQTNMASLWSIHESCGLRVSPNKISHPSIKFVIIIFPMKKNKLVSYPIFGHTERGQILADTPFYPI